MRRHRVFLSIALVVVVGIFGTMVVLQRMPTMTHAASSGDYPMFLGNLTHSGDNTNETIINPSTAHSLALAWKFTAGIGIVSSPVVVGGVLYFGAWDGYEYAVNISTHQQIWKQYLGITQQTKVCYGGHVGVSSTASVSNNVVYVGGGDGNIYALDAQNGSVLWKQFLGAPPYYIWSSPAVYNNRVYIGTAAFCDPPGVQGKLFAFTTSNGRLAGTFDVIPNGQTGPTITSSPAIDPTTNRIFVTTGNLGTINGVQNPAAQPYGEAFVALDAKTLNVVDHWQIPVADMGGDADFITSPTLFNAHGVGYIGASNKNGYYYVLNRNNLAAGSVWKYYLDGKVPASLTPEDNDAAACFNNGVLYVAGGIVNGGAGKPATYGSIHAFNPATGAQSWGFTTIGIIQSSLSCTGNGLVVDVQGSTVEVRNASSGSVLFHYTLGNHIQATPVISNGTLYVASRDGSVYAFTVNGTTP